MTTTIHDRAPDIGKCDVLRHGLQQGDDLADAVIAELDEHGTPPRTALQTGSRHGLAAVPDAPPAVTRLLHDTETAISDANSELLARGDRASLSIPAEWAARIISLAAILPSLAVSQFAKTLVRPGRLITTTDGL